MVTPVFTLGVVLLGFLAFLVVGSMGRGGF
jgi:hypothetical protein